MTESRGKRWLFSLFSFLLLATMITPFAKANEFSPTWSLYLFLFLLQLLLSLPWRLLRIAGTLVLTLWFLRFAIPVAPQLAFQAWLSAFIRRIQSHLQLIYQGNASYLHVDLALLFMVSFLLLLSLLILRFYRWRFAVFATISYLILLTIFNHQTLLLEGVLVSISSCGFLLTEKNSQRKNFRLLLFLNLIGVLAFTFPIGLPQVQKEVFFWGQPLRNRINQAGIFDAIADYGSGLNTLKRSGFSEDDTNLGGPLADDFTVLFTTKMTEPSYWRVETKTNYSGKGWTDAGSDRGIPADPFSLFSYPETLVKDSETINILPQETLSYLPLPYGNSQWNIPDSLTDVRYQRETERISFSPTKTEQQLSFRPLERPETIQEASLPDGMQMYTQLPDSLPDRVKELAVEITEGTQGQLEKVEAVQRYLRAGGGLRYSKIDAEYTPENRDYVDYFLFDTKVGYCDNFSTAMIVLLRSLEIPTRWAKGFNSGNIVETEDGAEITIRNADAHSWPEVYFTNYGWLPFEPTPAFSDVFSQNQSADSTLPTADASTSESNPESTTTTETTQISSSDFTQETLSNGRNYLRLVLILVVLVLLITAKFWLYYLLSVAIQLLSFDRGYRLLLFLFSKRLPRQPAETLTVYSQRTEAAWKLNGSWQTATKQYENFLYNHSKNPTTKNFLLESLHGLFFSKKQQ